jgi:hypothetical protein
MSVPPQAGMPVPPKKGDSCGLRKTGKNACPAVQVAAPIGVTSEGNHMPNVTRRTFLRSAGLTAAAITATGTGLPRVGLAADPSAAGPR